MERDKDVFVDVLRMKEAIRVESLSILPVFLHASENIRRIHQSRLRKRLKICKSFDWCEAVLNPYLCGNGCAIRQHVRIYRSSGIERN